jgi:hypothetical protein
MNASQRMTRNYSKWLRDRIRKLRKDTHFQNELDDVMTLRTGVWSEEYWRDQGWNKDNCEKEEATMRHALTQLACLSVSQNQGRPAILERVLASPTGKTWKALIDFPMRLETMAKEVAQFNAADPFFFARTPRWNVDRVQSANLRQGCEQLPSLMRSYANALKERNAATAKAAPRNGRFKALHDLSELVKFFTGAPRDKQVEQLQRAAALALGDPETADANAIAQVRYRRRKGSVSA